MPAEQNSIQLKIEMIAEAIVMVDATDLQALAALHTQFQDVAGQVVGGDHPAVISQAVKAAADLIEKVILSEVSDPAEALRTIAETVSALQEIIRDSRPAEQVRFPAQLGLASDQAAVEANPDAPSAEGTPVHPAVLPSNVDAKMFADFLARQDSVLDEMEGMILSLEKAEEGDNLRALQRLLHTLKGESAILGLYDVEKVCHATEDALGLTAPSEMVDGLLQIKDWLSQVFHACAGNGSAPMSVDAALAVLRQSGAPAEKTVHQQPDVSGPVKQACETALPSDTGQDAPAGSPPPARAATAVGANASQTDLALLQDFVTEAHEHLEAADAHLLTLETNPQDMEAVNAVFRAFHTIKGVSGCLGLDEVRALAHEAENLLDKGRKGELVLSGPPIDVSFDAVDALRRLVRNVRESLETGQPMPADEGMPALLKRIAAVAAGKVSAADSPAAGDSSSSERRRVGEILIDRGAASPKDVFEAVQRQSADGASGKLGEMLVHDGKVAAKEVAQALRTQAVETAAAKASTPGAVQVKEVVKIDAERLDRLLDTIGELVIAESMVSQSPELRQGASQDLIRHLSQLDKITRELQETGTSLRMVPIRATFQKMARLVRDLAKKFGKQIDFVTTGDDTELDKTVVDRIGDPLVHMVRNSMDHGLEATVEERRAAGKPDIGRVELRAFHKGGSIYIEIVDDGKGLNREAILRKAVERGLVAPDANPSDQEVWNLIFAPGLSTAKTVTDVSGRGVGMDVVKRNIEQLHGQIEIQSAPGKGTTFSIKLPLTLAIIDGMVIGVADRRYVVPTLSIVRSVRPERNDISTVLGRGEMLDLQGRLVPLFRLDHMFGIKGAEQDPTQAIVMIVEDEGRQVGLLIDDLLGQQQIVIKSLSECMQGVPGISGGAIMPDGTVGLILDVGGLVRLAQEQTDRQGVLAGEND